VVAQRPGAHFVAPAQLAETTTIIGIVVLIRRF
jgi:hypothetical protein